MPAFLLRACALALLLLSAGCATPPHAHRPAALLLVSVDGLRPADVNATAMPALSALGDANVRADGMRPSFPALTFPNHYALVTGLRPDRHGIVHNSMADAALGTFRTSDRTAVETGGWWGGVPAWVSVQRAGLRSATMFWPGSEADIDGVRPWQWRPYQDGTRAADSVSQVLQWLALPARERPRFVTMYLDQVDEASHDHGPDSAQAATARREVDAAIAQLLRGLRETGQADTVNLLVVSDHGFDTIPPGQVLRVEDMAPPAVADAVSDGQVIGFAPLPGNTTEAERLLLGRHPHYACWRKGELPARWHYGTHPRIPAIVCQMDAGWDALWPKKYATAMQRKDETRGSHGFDPDLPSMRATFIAAGPAFGRGVRLPVFDNVDVYPLLMRLLALPAEPNDGDIAPLLPALKDAHE
jgi:predicted AlkP superfamily pyrophosphatase or phosphodiesterase